MIFHLSLLRFVLPLYIVGERPPPLFSPLSLNPPMRAFPRLRLHIFFLATLGIDYFWQSLTLKLFIHQKPNKSTTKHTFMADVFVKTNNTVGRNNRFVIESNKNCCQNSINRMISIVVSCYYFSTETVSQKTAIKLG